MLRDPFFWQVFLLCFAALTFGVAGVRTLLRRQGALGYRGRRRRSHR